MNTATQTETKDQGPETRDPVFDTAIAPRTIVDRAEFARLIRKHRSVSVCVFVQDYLRDEVVRGCSEVCFSVDIPAKQALEGLEFGRYDAHVWEVDKHGSLCISFRVVPAWLQVARRREILRRRIAASQQLLAARPGDDFDVRWRARVAGEIARDEDALARLEHVATKAQPAAA